MATSEEMDHTAVDGSDEELPTQEDAAGERPYVTADRRHVDALLDMSEEEFLRELEPYEYHCYSGWDEAVRGWARVAPLSCILLNQKRHRKPKHKEADNRAHLSVDPTIPKAGSPGSNAEHRCESHVGLRNSLKKSMPLHQHMGCRSNNCAAALQKDASDWSVLNAMQKTTSNLSLGEKTEEGTFGETAVQNKLTKLQKHSHRPNNTVLPIKNLMFLPPIVPPHLNPQIVSGKRAPELETTEENCFLFDKKSGRTRGMRVEPVAHLELPADTAGLPFKHRTFQHSPHLFSAISVSFSKRYQMPMSSKRDTVHRASLSVGKTLTRASTPGLQQVHRPVCIPGRLCVRSSCMRAVK